MRPNYMPISSTSYNTAIHSIISLFQSYKHVNQHALPGVHQTPRGHKQTASVFLEGRLITLIL